MPAQGDTIYDLVVVGGGIGGLALASLAQRKGLHTALCESHTHLGGCAGWFDRGSFTFDCGATALMGMAPGEPIFELLKRVCLDFEALRTPEYRLCLAGDELIMTPDNLAWEATIRRHFPHLGENAARFWRIQERIGRTMFAAASGLPRLPLRSPTDIIHNLKILGLSGTAASATSFVTVMSLLRRLRLSHDPKFVALVAMLLQDTAQAGPETVPLANAAACLQAYRFGLSRPIGGMKALAEGLGEAFTGWGGNLRRATIVDSVSLASKSSFTNSTPAKFLVKTRRGEVLKARQVAFNLPVDLAMRLLGRSEKDDATLARKEQNSRAKWSAFTTYAAIDADFLAGHQALFHHVLQDVNQPIHDGNNVLISLSPPNDPGYAPADCRTATMSTHVNPDEWKSLSPTEYQVKKADYAARMSAALERAFPGVQAAIRHIEFASPRSFARYTRRTIGRVGGPPVSRRTANLMAVDPGSLGKGLWLVGDSVFPGQGTMAVVMCAMRVLERLSGETWYSDTSVAHFRPLALSEPAHAAT